MMRSDSAVQVKGFWSALVGADPLGAQRHDGGAPGCLCAALRFPRDGFEPAMVSRRREADAFPGAPAQDSHAPRSSKGILSRTLVVGGVHWETLADRSHPGKLQKCRLFRADFAVLHQ